METNDIVSDDTKTKADTVVAIENDVILSVIKNLNNYVENSDDISDKTILPIIIASFVMAVESVEEILDLQVAKLIIETLKARQHKKMN